MSGGSFNYMYQKILEQYEGSMLDSELEELLVDFCDLLHDLEWFEDGDIGEKEYRKTVADFKLKWFNRHTLEKQTALTPDKIQEAVKQIDYMLRPQALIVSPRLKAKLIEAYPELETRVLIKETTAVDPDKAYLMDRKYIEDVGDKNWMFGGKEE